MTTFTMLEFNARVTIEFLDGLADRLDKWAKESEGGGWSTHQVSANLSAANDCRRVAGALRSALNTAMTRRVEEEAA